jgi:hypothetical protein
LKKKLKTWRKSKVDNVFYRFAFFSIKLCLGNILLHWKLFGQLHLNYARIKIYFLIWILSLHNLFLNLYYYQINILPNIYQISELQLQLKKIPIETVCKSISIRNVTNLRIYEFYEFTNLRIYEFTNLRIYEFTNLRMWPMTMANLRPEMKWNKW